MTRSYNKVDGGQSTARVRHTEEGAYADRNRDARLYLAGRALDEPDPEAWLRDILSALGLDGATDNPPSPVALLAPDKASAPGPRPKTATQYAEPKAPKAKRQPAPRSHSPECGTRGGFDKHQRGGEDVCAPCRDARNAYERDRRAAARDRDRAAAGRVL